MKHAVLTPPSGDDMMKLPALLQRIAEHSARPRYTYMVLDLISTIARDDGRAGPYVEDEGMLVPIREWLSIAIAPMASHHHRRLALSEQVRTSLGDLGLLSDQDDVAMEQVEAEVRSRIRISGMTAVSRAVSELVKAGLVKRHYQGFRVDHENRGAQRLAVYTVAPSVRHVLRTGKAAPASRGASAQRTPAHRRTTAVEPRQRSLSF